MCIAPVTSPSRRSALDEALHPRGATGARAPIRRRARDVVLHDRERRLDEPARGSRPADQRRDVREAAVGQEAEQLELGVHAGLDPAVRPSGRAHRRRRARCSTAPGPSATTRVERASRRSSRNSTIASPPARQLCAHRAHELARRAPDRQARRRPSSRRPRRSRSSPALAAGESRAAPGRASCVPGAKRISTSASASIGSSVSTTGAASSRTRARSRGLRTEPALRQHELAGARSGTGPRSRSPSLTSSSSQLEPEESARRERQQVRQLADPRETASGRTSPRAPSLEA